MAAATAPVTGDPNDVRRAIEFLRARFGQFVREGILDAETQKALDDSYALSLNQTAAGSLPEDFRLRPRDQCWSCRGPVAAGAAFCVECGAPAHNEEVDTLRYLSLFCHEVNKHQKAGRLTLATAHDLLAAANEWIVARRKKLDRERVPLVEEAEEQPQEAVPVRPRRPRKPEPPRRPLMEILLDPRSIQWLLASGGLLLVLGLVIWLATIGLWEEPKFVAVVLGVANAAVLAGGWATIRFSRYQTAGRALTLLACLAMPLNLWFYDAQNLIPLRVEGSHLWVAALVCCVLYAVSARLLRDPMFVYVFAAGVTMTGLLLLADKSLDRIWEITAPVTLLISLGLIFLHAECVFPPGEGDFSRKRFGLAFFWSGHVVLAAGLLLLLGAQLCGSVFYPALAPLYKSYDLFPPEVVTTQHGRLLALFLVLAGTYGYVYSDLFVRRVGVYIYVAVFTLLWAEVLALNLVHWANPYEVVVITLALTALAVNLGRAALAGQAAFATRAAAPLGLFLSTLPVLLGVLLHFQATTTAFPQWHYELTWVYVVAMLLTAVSCRVGAFLYRHDHPSVSLTYFFGTAAATMVGAAGLLFVLGLSRWEDQAPLLILIPILYVLAARLYRGHTAEKPLVWVGHAATAVMLVSSLGAAVKGFAPVHGQSLNLSLALFFAEAAVFYVLTAALHKQEAGVYLATAMACAAVWQLLKYTTLADEYYILTFAVVGLGLLIGYRFAALDRQIGGLGKAAFISGNVLVSLAFVAAALLVLSELVSRTADRGLLLTLLALLEVIGLAVLYLVRVPEWRRWYVAACVANAGLFVLVLAVLSTLTPGERLEIVSLTLGLALLVAGHLGWYREREGESELVTLALVFGCLLVAVPLAVVVVWGRSGTPSLDTFHWLNEIGMLAAGLLLLATGFIFQIRSTTVTGAVLLALWLVTLVLYVHLPRELQTWAVYLMIGGGLFFGTGLLLSLYRDRLLTLPDRIKRREGIYRVLSWR
jgi:hypothetical protein